MYSLTASSFNTKYAFFVGLASIYDEGDFRKMKNILSPFGMVRSPSMLFLLKIN